MSSSISDGNENNEEPNDGNRNKQENDKREDNNAEIDVATFRSVIGELKELYNEFLIQIKLMQKDLSRASKCDELESKVCISRNSGSSGSGHQKITPFKNISN